jgi:hypothetical protein
VGVGCALFVIGDGGIPFEGATDGDEFVALPRVDETWKCTRPICWLTEMIRMSAPMFQLFPVCPI